MDTALKSRKSKNFLNYLRKIAQDFLYSEERIKEMMEALSSVKEQIAEMEKQNYKGFGNECKTGSKCNSRWGEDAFIFFYARGSQTPIIKKILIMPNCWVRNLESLVRV